MKAERNSVTILHTADWHIGQLFYEYDRAEEHQYFLDWLSDTLVKEEIDILLISGDVFDLSNPSAASVKQFYSFLNKATRLQPTLQIIITAGNHDSASRLESPKPLLESSRIHIVGLVEQDIDKLLIPLRNHQGAIIGWCIAIPFLRAGDYPSLPEYTDPYAEGVAALYAQAYEAALQRIEAGQPIIAMGHLHVKAAEVSDLDKLERQIMGGVECLSVDAFHPDLKYVALGHIHKAQRVAGKEHIRYSGSPLPLSFAELNYKHQVSLFTLEGDNPAQIRTLEVPGLVPLLRVPQKPAPLSEVLEALRALPEAPEPTPKPAATEPEPEGVDGAKPGAPPPSPFLEVRVLLDRPEPALRHQIESVLKTKNVRLAKIDVQYAGSTGKEQVDLTLDQVQELKPEQVFAKVYATRYQQAPPEEINRLLTEVIQDLSQTP